MNQCVFDCNIAEVANDLAVYDACYLSLAEFHDCSLITEDQRMRNILAGSPHARFLMSLADFMLDVS